MTLKKEITQYVIDADYEALITSAEKALAQTLRYVQMHIWGDDRLITRWQAIEALNRLAKTFAWRNDEEFRNLLRRCLWAMNDESGNVPWAAPEVMAAVIKDCPKQYSEFIPMMITNGFDNDICRKGTLWAIGFLGAAYKEQLAPFLPQVMTLLNDNNGDIRGYSCWALGQIDYQPAMDQIEKLKNDSAVCLLYQASELHSLTVGEIVQAILQQ